MTTEADGRIRLAVEGIVVTANDDFVEPVALGDIVVIVSRAPGPGFLDIERCPVRARSACTYIYPCLYMQTYTVTIAHLHTAAVTCSAAPFIRGGLESELVHAAKS